MSRRIVMGLTPSASAVSEIFNARRGVAALPFVDGASSDMLQYRPSLSLVLGGSPYEFTKVQFELIFQRGGGCFGGLLAGPSRRRRATNPHRASLTPEFFWKKTDPVTLHSFLRTSSPAPALQSAPKSDSRPLERRPPRA